MKLIVFELKKLLGMRFLRVCLLVLLSICFALSFFAAESSQKEAVPHRELEAFFDLYFENRAEMDAYYNELVRGEIRDPMQEQRPQQAEQKYAPDGYTDLQMFTTLYAAIEQAQGHPERMDGVVESAEKNLAEFRAMGIPESSYNYRLQQTVIRTYTELKSTVRIGIEPTRGWEICFNHSAQNALLFALILLVSISVASCDRTVGMLPVIACTKRGKQGVSGAKIVTLMPVTVCLVLLFSLTSFAAVGLACGYSSASNAIQSVPGFALCPYALSIGQYLVLSLLLRAAAFCLFAAVSALICALIRNRAFSFGAGLLLLGSQYALNNISYINPDFPWKSLNLIALTDASPLFARLRTCNLLGMPCPYVPLAFCLCVILTAPVLMLFWLVFVRRQGGSAKKQLPCKLPVKLRELASKCHLPIFMPKSLFGIELYKMLIVSGMVFVILLLGAGKIAYAQYAYRNPNTVSDRVYYKHMTELEGPLTEQKLLYIQEKRNEIDQTLAKSDQMQEDFIAGKITQAQYAAYLEQLESVKSEDAHWAIVEQKRDRLLSLSEQGWLVYDTGWLKLHNSRADLLLLLAIALFASHAFSMEYRRSGPSDGFASILRATPKGRSKTYFAKLAAVLCVSVGLCVLFSLIDLLSVATQYALPAANAPLASLPGFESIAATCTIGGYYALMLTCRCAFALLTALGIFSLSCLLRRSLYAMAIGIVIALPISLTHTAIYAVIPVLLLSAVAAIAAYRKFST